MQPADCEDTKRSVHEYLHNELAEAEIGAITAHLANCESCEQSYDVEVILNQVIQRSCDEAPTEELAQRVLRRLREVQQHGA
jgi:mycothiol system anti-sigma-R factor